MVLLEKLYFYVEVYIVSKRENVGNFLNFIKFFLITCMCYIELRFYFSVIRGGGSELGMSRGFWSSRFRDRFRICFFYT